MNRRHFLAEAAAGLAVAAGGTSMRQAAAEPPQKDGASFCFCVISDPHCAEEPKEGLKEYGRGIDKFFLALRAIDDLGPQDKPDFALLLGDIHPAALKERISEIPIPVHATPGNHEASKENRKALRNLFPNDFHIDGVESDYYSFVHKGVRFISMCDAGAGGDHVGHFCSEVTEPPGQCAWIEKELSAPEASKVVFAHIPLERNGEDVNMFLSRNDSQWFKGVIERTKPSAAFFGHLHHPTEEYQIGPTRLFQVRSCSWNFENAPIGFLHVRLTPGGLACREIITAEYR